MKHWIGKDYRPLIAQMRKKRDLPLIGRLNLNIDFDELKNYVLSSIKDHEVSNNFDFDPASSEHNYHLKKRDGNSFIENYDDFYREYSIVGYQELSLESKKFIDTIDYKFDDLTPKDRMRGMQNTGYERYHPYYDERNYTRKTQYCTGPVEKLIDSFQGGPCRSALVCLRPGRSISPHFDVAPEYIVRLMVPIKTNPKSVIGFITDQAYQEYHLPSDGSAYFINSGFEHYAINGGDEPRYQIRICLNGQEDLDLLEEVPVQRTLKLNTFNDHPYLGKNSVL